jgi:hypothetical protein
MRVVAPLDGIVYNHIQGKSTSLEKTNNSSANRVKTAHSFTLYNFITKQNLDIHGTKKQTIYTLLLNTKLQKPYIENKCSKLVYY